MFDALMNYFWSIFNTEDFAYFTEVSTFTIGGAELTITDYLAFLCTLVSLVFIVVLCCLFVYKIIKLIGGLIR